MGERIIQALKYIADCTLGVIYPVSNVCIACGEETSSPKLCKKCEAKIMKCNQSIMLQSTECRDVFKCFSAAYYSNVVVELVLALKYKSDFAAGNILAEYMIDLIKEMKFDIITFVPSDKQAFKKRGYNQSEFLAKAIGKFLNVPVKEFIKKSRATKDQIGLDKEARWHNLNGSFKVHNNKLIENKIILLVDDVITTGATAYYCAKELKISGAKEVIVLTAAKSRI